MFPIRDTILHQRKPYITLLIITINLLVFFRQLNLFPAAYEKFLYTYAFIPGDLYRIYLLEPTNMIQYFPILTGTFLHGSWFHILSNLWILWIFGDNVEDKMGHLGFLIFYILSGVIANLTHFAFDPVSSIPTIGASGAIAGVMGAYLVLFPFSRILTLVPIIIIPLFFRIPAVVFLMLWFLTQIYSGTAALSGVTSGGVAWWAHIGGFIFGALFYRFFLDRNFKESTPQMI